MISNDNPKGKKSSARRQSQRAKASKQETGKADELYDDISGSFLLKYTINDKGIGHIILPPSLSMVLQSDQVYISPSGGGLFIRSISEENSRDLQLSKLST